MNLGPQDDHYCAYKAGIDVLATLLQQAVQLDDGDVVELNPAYQPAQSLVREGERRAMIFLAVPQDPCQGWGGRGVFFLLLLSPWYGL